jgi:hypothetical protein
MYLSSFLHLFPLHFFTVVLFSFFSSFQTRGLEVNTILDLLEDNPGLGVQGIYLNPPEGDDSDGYDDSDTEEGGPEAIHRNLLQATVAEVITDGNIDTLVQYLDIDELPDPDEAEAAEPAPNDNAELAPSRWKTYRDAWKWEKKARSFKSKANALFPEPNYTQFKEMAPVVLFDLFFDEDILSLIATRSCAYSMRQFGTPVTISAADIRVFIAILILSGYNKVTDYKLYWSNSLDTENRLVKGAMSRNRFLLIKRCFHLVGYEPMVENDRSVVDIYSYILRNFPHLCKKNSYLLIFWKQKFEIVIRHGFNMIFLLKFLFCCII